jgi:hypothetical protein
MASAIWSLRWLTGSSGGYLMGGIAARRAARAAADASARADCEPERPVLARLDLERPDRACAGAASSGEDITDRGSIPAGRIDQNGPRYVTVFGLSAFHQRDGFHDHEGFCTPGGTKSFTIMERGADGDGG